MGVCSPLLLAKVWLKLPHGRSRAAETRLLFLSHVIPHGAGGQALLHETTQGSRRVGCPAILSIGLPPLGLRNCSNDCLAPARGNETKRVQGMFLKDVTSKLHTSVPLTSYRHILSQMAIPNCKGEGEI